MAENDLFCENIITKKERHQDNKYNMDGKENLSTNCGYREFSAEDRKKAGQVNNMLMLGLAAVACVAGAAIYVIA